MGGSKECGGKDAGKDEAEEIFQAIRSDDFNMYENTDPGM